MIRSMLAAMLLLVAAAAGAGEEKPAPRVVDHVDLDRYLGTWYELARIPNRFQKGCDRNTTATYSRSDDGKLKVVNRCLTADGEVEEVEGVAREAAGGNPARLEVSFVSLLGLRLFWGDYWILGLGDAPDYGWAVVGSPDRRYGWILSRSPSQPDSTLQTIADLLRDRGYDPADFIWTEQDPRP